MEGSPTLTFQRDHTSFGIAAIATIFKEQIGRGHLHVQIPKSLQGNRIRGSGHSSSKQRL